MGGFKPSESPRSRASSQSVREDRGESWLGSRHAATGGRAGVHVGVKTTKKGAALMGLVYTRARV